MKRTDQETIPNDRMEPDLDTDQENNITEKRDQDVPKEIIEIKGRLRTQGKEERAIKWPIISVLILVLTMGLLVTFLRQITNPSKPTSENSNVQSIEQNGGYSNSNSVPPNSKSVQISIMQGDTSSVMGGLLIKVNRISFDKDLNAYKVNVIIWLPNQKQLEIPNQEATREIMYTYNNFKVQIVSADANTVDFLVTQ